MLNDFGSVFFTFYTLIIKTLFFNGLISLGVLQEIRLLFIEILKNEMLVNRPI